MTISVEDLLEENKWDDEERGTVARYLAAAQQIVKNAGAYDESSDILPLVLSSMVASMMEHRGEANRYSNVRMFPLSIQALINSMRFNLKVGAEDG